VLTAPDAYLTVVSGGLEDACDRILEAQAPDYTVLPASERELPVIYNEYLDSWGRPTEESILAQIELQKKLGSKYLVIDAGWYYNGNWSRRQGDWQVSLDLFPGGIKAITKKIREAGLVPGIWFEFEVVGDESEAFQTNKEHFLTRDGKMVFKSQRAFWDLRKEEARQYLFEHVIEFLRENDFGYIKVDYNETIGIGVDGAESLGEGLRQCVLQTHAFFARMKQELPELVIENCSSGGHRLEPSMMNLCSMASFSDAHECVDIPLIAAAVARMIPAAKSQIWACLQEKDTLHRAIYSLANGFLGRLCLSGKAAAFTGEKGEAAKKAVVLYDRCKDTIRDGASRLQADMSESWTKPLGWQGSVRVRRDGKQAVVVLNLFENVKGLDEIVLHDARLAGMKVVDSLCEPGVKIGLQEDGLHISTTGDFQGVVVCLEA
jgi:alpha-galactosidase